MAEMTGETAQTDIVVHPLYFGCIEDLTPGSDWINYVERLQMFFEVDSAPTDKCVPSILNLDG